MISITSRRQYDLCFRFEYRSYVFDDSSAASVCVNYCVYFDLCVRAFLSLNYVVVMRLLFFFIINNIGMLYVCSCVSYKNSVYMVFWCVNTRDRQVSVAIPTLPDDSPKNVKSNRQILCLDTWHIVNGETRSRPLAAPRINPIRPAPCAGQKGNYIKLTAILRRARALTNFDDQFFTYLIKSTFFI